MEDDLKTQIQKQTLKLLKALYPIVIVINVYLIVVIFLVILILIQKLGV